MLLFDPDEKTGLSDKQVQERLEHNEVNRKVNSSTKTVAQIVRSNVLTYFNMIFLILGVLLGIVGAWRDMVFLLVIIANTAIGIIQEIHSKNVLDNLSILNAPKTQVIRNGKTCELPSEELVLEDVILLESGNQIPADAVVMSGEIQVNESLITGEADEITKKSKDRLLSGSFVVSGQAHACLTQVGADSYISKLTMQATRSKDGEQSEMIRSLNRLIKVFGFIILPIGIVLFVQSYVFNRASFYDSIVGMVAAVIGMIPEGLYLLASVAMAVSTVRLAKQQVLIHDMKSIETLARVNVLCVDKTGTITEPGMSVYHFDPLTESGYSEEAIGSLIGDFVKNMPPENATMLALRDHFKEGDGKTAQKIISFSSRYKYSGMVLDGKNLVVGAPEFVLRERLGELQEQIIPYSKRGFRVLVFCEYQGTFDSDELNGNCIPLALIALSNPIRKGAKATFSYFAKRGVAIKVISGDNPQTVSAISVEAGIHNADRYVDAATLQTKEDYRNAVKKYTVFGRVTPNQKRQLVKALKENKMTVAMTGDGVNDVLALKDADCSIAMASGSDAASQVAQLVLLDSDFSRMPSVIMEGRRVVNNIERTASLYIVKNIFSILLSVFSVLLLWQYPLEPSQISLISMFTIGIPSFILALEPNRNQIRGHFLTNVFLKALPAGLTDFIVVSCLVIFCAEFSVDPECLSTSCTILVAIVGFMILYRIAQPMNKWHIIMMVGVILGWLYCMIFISHFFAITSISKQCAMLMLVFAIITEPLLRYFSLAVDWGRKKIKRFF